MRRGNASSFYHFDALGSADRLTGADQAVTDAYLIRAFGLDTVLSGTTVNPYRFVAAFGYYKTAASLLHLGARLYDAPEARFLSREAEVFLLQQSLDEGMPYGPSAVHPYLYVNNRAVSAVDPSGMCPGAQSAAADDGAKKYLEKLKACAKKCYKAKDFWICFAKCAVNVGSAAVCQSYWCEIYDYLPQILKNNLPQCWINACPGRSDDEQSCQECCDVRYACCVVTTGKVISCANQSDQCGKLCVNPCSCKC
jgi:RHS repeat-associated protein